VNLSTLYALEVARDRERQLEHHRLLAESRFERSRRPSRARRSAALVLAAFSRGSAAAVRRLDGCVADDLSRSFAPTE
jgi:hypothetical protein